MPGYQTKQEQIAVAGVDRMELTEQLAVMDLIALGQFLLLPEDDLTLAARFATHVMALREGRLAAFGPTAPTLTPALLREVVDVEARISGEGPRAYVDFLGLAEPGP